MNKVILKGRITADIELKTTSNGIEYCQFTVAIDRRTGKDSEKVTDFIPCKAWRQTAVFIEKYFSKGKEIIVEGSIQVDKFEKDGEKKTFTTVSVQNVEFCGGKSSGTDPLQGFATSNPETVNSGINIDMAVDDDLNF